MCILSYLKLECKRHFRDTNQVQLILAQKLADSIGLPCRIARGCKYCVADHRSSCLVKIDDDKKLPRLHTYLIFPLYLFPLCFFCCSSMYYLPNVLLPIYFVNADISMPILFSYLYRLSLLSYNHKIMMRNIICYLYFSLMTVCQYSLFNIYGSNPLKSIILNFRICDFVDIFLV